MEIRYHSPTLGQGKNYLKQFAKFDKATRPTTGIPNQRSGSNEIVDGFASQGRTKSHLVARYKDSDGLTSANRFKNDETGDETVDVHHTVLGGPDRVGTVTDRVYSDQGNSIRVSERFLIIKDAKGSGSMSQANFTVDKSTGAIAVFED